MRPLGIDKKGGKPAELGPGFWLANIRTNRVQFPHDAQPGCIVQIEGFYRTKYTGPGRYLPTIQVTSVEVITQPEAYGRILAARPLPDIIKPTQ